MKRKKLYRRTAAAAPVAGMPPAVAGALLATLSASELLVALYDAQDRLCWCNDAYAQRFLDGLTLPLPFAELLRHDFRRGIGVRIDCGDIEAFLSDILPRRRQQPFRAIEVDTLDGRWWRMAETLLPEGWLLCVATDITPLKRGELRLREARAQAETEARTDMLTGAPNRRHVFEFGAATLSRCAAAGQACSVALIDLDHFKQINDRHGHDVGDAVLRAFAGQARARLRGRDLFGRLGGEEFLLLLPGVRQEQAREVTQRLRQALQPLALHQGALHYAFSAGVAQAAPGDDMDRLIARADRALYRAKLLGRGRTELASEGDDDGGGSGLNTAASS
ncbi:GGDEF domain-containing protein [Azohydromonas caseinilytica]|uniref:diguanylate cyclase n=1 Tax=Azohydromonas caseinilytica TaxID=2728836 RepID=A0A848FGV2_9BURK|nr:sensor domain-containing diguanylate cyclase [Azohydromonas caseinilytica]NML18492.1 diguanylate cyclase [Azohydromonas caseinilytica]